MAAAGTVSVTDARGRVTIYDGPVPVVRVSSRGTAERVVRPPVWARVVAVHYVAGRTLDRVAVIERRAGGAVLLCVIRRAAPQQLTTQCDACPKRHRHRNTSCSANLGLDTFARRPGHLYDIHTRRDVGAWSCNATFLGKAKTGVGLYTRL